MIIRGTAMDDLAMVGLIGRIGAQFFSPSSREKRRLRAEKHVICPTLDTTMTTIHTACGDAQRERN